MASCLTANPHGAEAQDYVTAVGRAAKTEHRPETGEHQDLVELMTRLLASRAGKNFVAIKLALGVDADVNEQPVGRRSITVGRFRGPGCGIIRQGEQFR